MAPLKRLDAESARCRSSRVEAASSEAPVLNGLDNIGSKIGNDPTNVIAPAHSSSEGAEFK